MVEEAGAAARVIRKPEQLAEVQGLVIPGGESSTLLKLMDAYGFWEPLRLFAQEGKPILGTCAGMILLAREVSGPAQRSLGLIEVDVERNSYGRQRESFEAVGTFAPDGTESPLPMVFIRAPRIRRLGDGVQGLAFCQGECVMAQQERILVASFHPELTGNLTVHRYFLDLAR
jgi:5'-phosphate synthase pdxT subunit